MNADSVVYCNEQGGTLVFSGLPPYVLSSLDGLYAANAYERTTVKAEGQQGESVIGGSFAPRVLKLTLTVVGENRERLRALCENAASILTPTLSGQLTMDTPLGRRSLRVWPDSTPALSLQTECCAGLVLTLTAYEPLFLDAEAHRTEMAAYKGGFHFPLELQDGWVLGERVRSRLVTVQNPGQTVCGLQAIFEADGTVRDPYLRRVGTDEKLTLQRDLIRGDRLELLSYPARKRLELVRSGERSNVMGQLAPESRFPLLAPGSNLLLCGALEGEDMLRVTLSFKPEYAI